MKKIIFIIMLLLASLSSSRIEKEAIQVHLNKTSEAEACCTGTTFKTNTSVYEGPKFTPGSLGRSYYDQIFAKEIEAQRAFFNFVPAIVKIWQEPGFHYRNAMAKKNEYGAGEILFGTFYFDHLIKTYGKIAVAGVLAHEWAHLIQLQFSWVYSKNEYQELEADAFSGFYLALTKQASGREINRYYRCVFDIGDYDFTSKKHHGTPFQRLNAVQLGVELGLKALTNNIQFSYQELHDYFLMEIRDKIVNRDKLPQVTLQVPRGHR